MERNNSYQNDLKDAIRNLTKEEMYRNQFTDLYVVTKVNTFEDAQKDSSIKEFTCDIQQLDSLQKFKNVPIVSQGLGNGKGFMVMPKKNDIVLVLFYGQTNAPLIIGSVFNTFMQGNRLVKDNSGQLVLSNSGRNDEILDLDKDEWIIIAKINGCYIYGNKNNEIKIANNNGFLILKNDGRVNINDAYTLPKTDGSAGQVLKTDGNGNVTWQNDTDT